MATETTTPVVYKVSVNGQDFSIPSFVRKSGDSKGQPYLALDPKSTDLPTIVRFLTALGAAPAVSIVCKALNKVIADATESAFKETPDGKIELDRAAASKNIVDSANDTLSAVKAEIEAKLAEVRAKVQAVWDSLLPLLAKGQTAPQAEVMRLSQLTIEEKQLEAKLVKKARKPKTPASATTTPAAA